MEMDIDEPRGTKRKADELSDPNVPRRIKALHPDVINKIAAGEIIVAPVHALKELVENAVDAGSTSIEVLVKEGGLKILQITDNGCGIRKEDLPILCERFTTSKLQTFEDLRSIATYGFRGEALASISHIAHLTVTSKTADSDCAWRARYDGGKLTPSKPGQSAEPKPVAGRQGTQILVEDLFYNVESRRRAFRSPSDEYNKIIDVLGRYAVHCSNVGFSCKKHGEASTSISVQANLSVVDRIRQIYGGAVAQELVEFSSSDSRWGFKAQGWATNANYSVKKTTLLLFINHRCVESGNIRKAIEQTYASFLPKNGHPFVYLSLEVDPQRVDVNVHPTKKEVNFMNEDEIIQAICEDIRSRLASVDTSRTFMTQTLLPGVLSSASGSDTPEKGPQSTRKMIGKTPVRIYENNLVRTDASMRKITSMLPTVAGPSTSKSEPRPYEIDYETTDREPMPCRLSSVHKLRAEVRDDMHKELTEMFASHAFVGIVDEQRRLAAIQGGIKLYLIDYGRVCFEYFYQVGLTDFNNFGTIRFGPPLDLREVIKIAAEHERDVLTRDGGAADFSVADIAEKVASQLIERREMLQEYFSMEITPAGELRSIPLLIKGYTPSMAKLPQFLLRLGPHVDWTNEIGCFRSLVREIASFYVPEPLPPAQEEGEVAGDGVISNEVKQRRDAVRWAVEHVLFPAFKSRLVATNGLMKDGILELTNLKSLYRVFERC